MPRAGAASAILLREVDDECCSCTSTRAFTRGPTKARTEEDALKFLHALEARVRAGQVGLAAPTKEERAERAKARERAAMSVRELCDKFLAEYRSPKLKDREHYIDEARSTLSSRVWPSIGDLPAAKVTTERLEVLRDFLLGEDYKPRSVIMAFAVLGKVYEWARRAQLLDVPNPAWATEKPAKGPTSLEFLSKREVGVLLAHAEANAPDVHPMIATAVYTGMRKGDLYGLRWQDVHLDAARIDVMRSYKLARSPGRPATSRCTPSWCASSGVGRSVARRVVRGSCSQWMASWGRPGTCSGSPR